ncbi:MAG: hypothetical protein OEO23_00895 [Gemmatimonadota bacterium]|nr:hypothetical protein [Gemmatimonadota bacterium]
MKAGRKGWKGRRASRASPASRRGWRSFLVVALSLGASPQPGDRTIDLEATIPMPGVLPAHRVVAFYGNPRSPRMGILGSLPTDSMLVRLRDQVSQYAAVDPGTPILPALHLVTVVAQREPGSSGLYRNRMPQALVDSVLSWADSDSLLLFLDIQPGRSPVLDEVRAYDRFLRRPNVHLALDPEFVMEAGGVPGRHMGRLRAEEVNLVIAHLSSMVKEAGVPPKLLVIHRFTGPMLQNPERIEQDPRVQVVIDMDGFGTPGLKRHAYRSTVTGERGQFAGIKLFYRQDSPLMTPAEVLALRPTPHFVLYQ